jgi:hypothetical protein
MPGTVENRFRHIPFINVDEYYILCIIQTISPRAQYSIFLNQ